MGIVDSGRCGDVGDHTTISSSMDGIGLVGCDLRDYTAIESIVTVVLLSRILASRQ